MIKCGTSYHPVPRQTFVPLGSGARSHWVYVYDHNLWLAHRGTRHGSHAATGHIDHAGGSNLSGCNNLKGGDEVTDGDDVADGGDVTGNDGVITQQLTTDGSHAQSYGATRPSVYDEVYVSV